MRYVELELQSPFSDYFGGFFSHSPPPPAKAHLRKMSEGNEALYFNSGHNGFTVNAREYIKKDLSIFLLSSHWFHPLYIYSTWLLHKEKKEAERRKDVAVMSEGWIVDIQRSKFS